MLGFEVSCPSDAQGLLPALFLGIIPDGILGTTWSARNQTWLCAGQMSCPLCSLQPSASNSSISKDTVTFHANF